MHENLSPQARIQAAARLVISGACDDRPGSVVDMLARNGVLFELDGQGRVRVLALADDGLERRALTCAAQSWLARPNNQRRATAMVQFQWLDSSQATIH